MDWSVSLLVIFLIPASVLGIDICAGEVALGMSTGAIANSSITSSSFQPGSEPSKGRIISNNKWGAWCPANEVDMDSYEWIQVELNQISTIFYVGIAGEFNDGEGTRYASKFRVEFQRTEDDEWKQYVTPSGVQIFDGNTNTRSTEYLNTQKTLIASRLRIIPLMDVRDEVCLRVEFYGCPRSGIATYSAPPGDSRGEHNRFIDHNYDGAGPISPITGGLTGGLGLLTNGTTGDETYSSSPYEWLGWRNDQRSNVTLLFEMDHLRNISGIRINSNNQYSKDIRVFKQAIIYASIGEARFINDPVKVFNFSQDSFETSRSVRISLDHIVAKYIKIVLLFDAKWIMISEVTFQSERVIGHYTDEITSSAPIVPPTTSAISDPEIVTTIADVTAKESASIVRPVVTTTGPDIIVGVGGNSNNDVNNKLSDPIDGSLIGIIVGSCVGVILVVVLIIIVCCVYQRRKTDSSTNHHFSATDDSTMSLPPLQKTSNVESSEYDLPWGSRPLPHPPQSGATLQSSGYVSDGAQYACIPIGEQYNNCQQSATSPRPACLHHYMMSGGLLTLPGIHHDRHHCSNVINRPANTLPANAHNNILIPLNNKGQIVYDPNSYDLVQPDSCGSPYDSSNYRSSPTVPLPNIQGSTGNSVYGTHIALPVAPLDEELPVISQDSLRFLEKLGAGQYGEVHLCELTTSSLGSKSNLNNNKRLVAVKKLQPTANEATKNDFIREIRIMGKLRHENIVQVLGACSSTSATDSPCVVTEYMSRGDLHQFLQKHVPEGTVLLNKQTLGQSTLLYIASQISQGMSYLEQLNVTHRDLAARNCLVGEHYQVKISDFGMSRSLYSQQYYKVEGRVVLPIRWMAWESVLLGKFTTKSDVWSFGVTLWEIFSFARAQPFSMLSDDDVIANCMNFYHNNMQDVITLNQPSQCTKEIYDLMRACWNLSDFNRPTFKDISLFLQRKSPTAQNNSNTSTPDRRTSLTRLTTC